MIQDGFAGTIVTDRPTEAATRPIDETDNLRPWLVRMTSLCTGIIVAGVILLVSDGAHAESPAPTSTANFCRSATMPLHLAECRIFPPCQLPHSKQRTPVKPGNCSIKLRVMRSRCRFPKADFGPSTYC